jgi:hypothetical protein
MRFGRLQVQTRSMRDSTGHRGYPKSIRLGNLIWSLFITGRWYFSTRSLGEIQIRCKTLKITCSARHSTGAPTAMCRKFAVAYFFKQRQGRFLCCPVSPQCLTGRSHFSNRALHSVAPVHCEIVVREAAPGPRLCVQGKFDRRRQRERKFMVAKSFVIRKLGDSR